MLLIWLLVQLVALALGAGRVPLAAHWVVPGERGASVEMLVGQIVVAGLLFPSLLKDASSALIVAASGWPMLRLAGLLGGEEVSHIYAAAMYVTVWIGVLAVWRYVLTSEWGCAVGVAVAALWSIGGPVLLYLHAEFGGGGEVWPVEASVWTMLGGPVWSGVEKLRFGWGNSASDGPLFLLLLTGIILGLLRFFKSQQHQIKVST
jgi:hypothetical protein